MWDARKTLLMIKSYPLKICSRNKWEKHLFSGRCLIQMHRKFRQLMIFWVPRRLWFAHFIKERNFLGVHILYTQIIEKIFKHLINQILISTKFTENFWPTSLEFWLKKSTGKIRFTKCSKSIITTIRKSITWNRKICNSLIPLITHLV